MSKPNKWDTVEKFGREGMVTCLSMGKSSCVMHDKRRAPVDKEADRDYDGPLIFITYSSTEQYDQSAVVSGTRLDNDVKVGHPTAVMAFRDLEGLIAHANHLMAKAGELVKNAGLPTAEALCARVRVAQDRLTNSHGSDIEENEDRLAYLWKTYYKLSDLGWLSDGEREMLLEVLGVCPGRRELEKARTVDLVLEND